MRTLNQLDGPVSRTLQDELADSLVAFVRANGPDAPSYRKRTINSITTAIGIAGARNMDGTPSAGAGERLLPLALIVDPSTTAGLVFAMSELADQREALERLRTFATTSHPVAYVAINHLASMEPDGPVALRTLWDQQALTEPHARQSLRNIAGHLGWKQPTSPPLRPPPR